MTELVHRGSRRGARLAAIAAAVAIALPILAPATAVATASGFLPYQAIALPSEPDAVAIGDVTGDGQTDIVVTTGYSGNPATDFHLFIIPQAPDGSLLPPVIYATAGTYPQRPGSVDIGDIDGDGRADVVVGLDRYGIQVFPGQNDGTLGLPTLVLSPDSTRIRVGAFDASGRDQVAGIGWGTNTITQFADSGSGLAAVRTYAARHGGYDDLEVADVTGDGRLDFVVMSGQAFIPNLSVLAQQPDGSFGAAAEYSVGGNNLTHGIGVGDVTGDGRADVIASYGGNTPSAFIAVFAQTAAGNLAAPVSYPSYDIPEPVEVADFDQDGRADVATVHGGWLRAGVYRGMADGTLAPEELFPVPNGSSWNAHSMAVGDVNGDGRPDLVESDRNAGVIVLRNSGTWPPMVTLPGAPTLTSATPGDGRVTLAWNAPSSNGGSAITSYTATASPGGLTCVTGLLGCSVVGLTNNTTYTFTVRATNATGTGPASNALAATPGAAPSAPRSLATSPNLAAGVGLTWQAPSSPGSLPISGYRIYRGATSGTETLYAVVGAVLSYTDAGVVNGGQYVYKVSAINGFAEGPRSLEVAAQRGTAPTPPQTVSGSVGGPGITLRWSNPASNGGAAISGFRVYRGTASGAETLLASAGPVTTTYLDKAVGHKVRYFYRVTALNVLGESSPSNEVTLVSH